MKLDISVLDNKVNLSYGFSIEYDETQSNTDICSMMSIATIIEVDRMSCS